ncbi:unnamed protein product [Caenorhabditis angaria]|uniref:Cation-transporting P-type ATPase N-terminal domain-containing protein n=1 Tax=Caenorhabditis angaria TaxID=860376 RepID=A0A9P1IFC9_9PELO|nr:unnamed protein product [Caenorhabditis angaria]
MWKFSTNNEFSISFIEHQMPLDQISQRYSDSNINFYDVSKSKGLSDDLAEQKTKTSGRNELSPPKIISNWQLFLRQFQNLLWLLMFGAAALCFLTYAYDPTDMLNLYVGIFIVAIVFLMCLLSYFQEKKGIEVVQAFQNLIPKKCNVIRNGIEVVRNSKELVVGDIVIVRSGNRVPADIRILSCNDFFVESSSVTGEAEPLEHNSETADPGITIFESYNIAFNGSFCVDGEGYGLVIRIGEQTVIGQIASLTTNQIETKNRFRIEIERFVKFISLMALTMSTIIFGVGLIVSGGTNVVRLFVTGFLIVIIANVPQGLPTTISTQLTIIARRLANKNIYLKKLEKIDSLGATTVICTDKTGTLTENRLTVTDLWIKDGNIYKNTLRQTCVKKNQRFIEDDILDTIFVCNKSQNGIGNPLDVALIKYANQMAINSKDIYNKIIEIPFNPVRKYQAVLVTKCKDLNDKIDVEFILMIKGAPEILLKNCSEDISMYSEYQSAYDTFGEEGKRVIGFAIKKFRAKASTQFRKNDDIFLGGWDFSGLLAVCDPLREDAINSIQKCSQAGIKVFMTTGDHAITATAIAIQLGMNSNNTELKVITGPELAGLQSNEWDALLEHRYIVFARTTPDHKLLIVTECQKRGECVTVTGDGVNDAPALKKADVGVAMGIAGSDVAKQAADIILLDDNFSSIVAGIEEGRLLFDNLRKTIAYTMTHMWPELVPVMLNFFFGFPLGLTPVQILSIDLITDVPPAISLAYEGPEDGIMQRSPRKSHLFTRGLFNYTYLSISLFISIGGIISYLLTYWLNGIEPSELFGSSHKYFKQGSHNMNLTSGIILTDDEQINIAAQAAASFHICVVISQAFHIWMCLTRRTSIFTHGIGNIVTIFAVIIDLLLICLFTFVPGVNTIFGSQPPPWQTWLVPIVVGIWIWKFNEARKYKIRKNPSGKFAKMLGY